MNKQIDHRWSLIAKLSLGAIILLTGASLLLPAVGSRPVGPSGICRFNLDQIGAALRQYHDEYGCFPPAFVADKQGRPMHSWRVLILPYLSHDGIHGQYDFDEPWDGPNNVQLLNSVPQVYRCPSSGNALASATDYVAIVGEQAAFTGSTPRSLKDFKRPEATIMVVEVARSDIPWIEPRDLPLDGMTFVVGGSKDPGISSHHRNGANVLFADGYATRLPTTTKPETVKGLLTGEKVLD